MRIEINIPKPKYKVGDLVNVIHSDYIDGIHKIEKCEFNFNDTFFSVDELLSGEAQCKGYWLYRLVNELWLEDYQMKHSRAKAK